MLKGLAPKWLSPTFLSSAISLSTSQPSSRSFHTLAFYDYGDGYIVDVRPKILMSVTKLQPAAAFRNLCVKVKHLISRKFVLAQTATITIWELSQNGTQILRRTTSITAFLVCPCLGRAFLDDESNDLLIVGEGKLHGCAFSIYVLVFIHEIIFDYCATVARVLLNTTASPLEKNKYAYFFF